MIDFQFEIGEHGGVVTERFKGSWNSYSNGFDHYYYFLDSATGGKNEEGWFEWALTGSDPHEERRLAVDYLGEEYFA